MPNLIILTIKEHNKTIDALYELECLKNISYNPKAFRVKKGQKID